MPLHQVHLQVPATAGFSGRLYTGNGRIVYRAVKESTGAALAEVDLYDGSNATGILIEPVTLIANESARDWFMPGGVEFDNGLFVNVTSGTVSASITIVPEDAWQEWLDQGSGGSIDWELISSHLAAIG